MKRFLLVILRKITNDVWYIRIRFFFIYKRFINLRKPNSFFAKINLLKLQDRNPKYTGLVDKYEVRNYVEEKIGKEFLVKNLGVYTNPYEIDFEALPNRFILKATHGAAWNILCRDKSKLDLCKTQQTLDRWMKLNFYEMWGEYAYKDVVPRIISEELLENEPEPCLIDYKFHCFHGVPTYIQVDRNRFENHTLDFYDLDWNRLPFELWFPPSKDSIPRPAPLKKMIELAGILSNEFKYVRVDFYVVEDKIYFGELTFYPCNGFGVFKPKKMDFEFGAKLDLNRQTP